MAHLQIGREAEPEVEAEEEPTEFVDAVAEQDLADEDIAAGGRTTGFQRS